MQESFSNFVFFLGNSGAGKDTSMTIFEEVLVKEKVPVKNLQRVISRPSHPSEDFISVSATTFKALVDKKRFAFYWKIYDNYYGYLQDDIDYCIKNQVVALFNISRSLSVDIQDKYPDCKFIEILAPFDVSAKRVENRQRSSPLNVAKRIQRMHRDFDLPEDRFVINNSGTLEELYSKISDIIYNNFLTRSDPSLL